MNEIFLPYGFKGSVEGENKVVLKNKYGYIKMHGFPHAFNDAVFEYGDALGNIWDGAGKSITEGGKEDVGYVEYMKIVTEIDSVPRKIELRNRMREHFNLK